MTLRLGVIHAIDNCGCRAARIFNSNAGPVGSPWMWTLAFGYHEDRAPTHGYEASREAAMAAFAKSWRRE